MGHQQDEGGPVGDTSVRQDGGRFARYVAVGDSFTEGLGDLRADGTLRGWADLVAAQAADGYANLAVRGKLLGQIIDDQLEPALALRPDLVTFAGGGNDLLRPRADIANLRRLFDLAVARFQDTGATVVVFTGANPSDHLPMKRVLQAHGEVFGQVAREVAARRGVLLVDLWPDPVLRDRRYWSDDHLHLNTAGHQQVAARVLDALRLVRPEVWTDPAPAVPPSTRPMREQLEFYRQHVGPWVRRRLTGRSSGDNRPPKRPELAPVS